jgi:hypothetical protein
MVNENTNRDSGNDRDHAFWQRQSALDGIFRKFGQTLPLVDRVPGNVMIDQVTPDVIHGNLIAEDSSLRVRFESKDLGDFALLKALIDSRVLIDSSKLSNVMIPMRVSGRAWVEGNGSIVLLVRSFELQATAGRTS